MAALRVLDEAITAVVEGEPDKPIRLGDVFLPARRLIAGLFADRSCGVTDCPHPRMRNSELCAIHRFDPWLNPTSERR